MNENTDLPKIKLVFMYRFINAKGELRFQWCEFDNPETVRVYLAPKNRNIVQDAQSGDIYTFDYLGEGRITLDSATYIDTLVNDEIVEWRATDQVAAGLLAARREAKRKGSKTDLRKQLLPIRKAYGKMTSLQKAQLMAWVVNYIAGGKE